MTANLPPFRTCHPGRENHCVSGACGECWLCRSAEPAIPPPIPLGWPENALTWCVRCESFYATATKPLCVVCLDIETRGR